jgi:hypothetical protein
MSEINLSKIENMIYVVRDQKVMLFPEVFMLQLTADEFELLKF